MFVIDVYKRQLLEPVFEIVGALVYGAILGIILRYLLKLFTGRGTRLSCIVGMIFLCIGVSDMLGLSSLLACMMMSGVLVNISTGIDVMFPIVDR